MDLVIAYIFTSSVLFVNMGTASPSPDLTTSISQVNIFDSTKLPSSPADHTDEEMNAPVNKELTTEKSTIIVKSDPTKSAWTSNKPTTTTQTGIPILPKATTNQPETYVAGSTDTNASKQPPTDTTVVNDHRKMTQNMNTGLTSISRGKPSLTPPNNQPDSQHSTSFMHTVPLEYTGLKTEGEIKINTDEVSEGTSSTIKLFVTVNKGDTDLNGFTENGVHETDITKWSSAKPGISVTGDNIGSTPSTERANALTQTSINMDRSTRPATMSSSNKTVSAKVSEKFTTTPIGLISNTTTKSTTNSLNSTVACNVSSVINVTAQTTIPPTTSSTRTNSKINSNSPQGFNLVTSIQSEKATTKSSIIAEKITTNNSTSTPTPKTTETTLLSTVTSNTGHFGDLTSPKTIPDSYVQIAAKDITIHMALSVSDIFTADLKNITSDKYKSLKKKFEHYLTDLYKDIQGFKSISVTGFRNGSIVASYLLELNDVSSIRQAVQDVNLTLRQGIQNASITNNYDLQIEQTKTLALLDTTLQEVKDICNLYRQPCPFGYQCTSRNSLMYTCESKCSKKHNPCGVNSECLINHEDEHVKCRCIEDDAYVYSGQFCEVATEKLKLKSTYIIVITASGGAVFLVVIFVLSVCLCRLRAKKRMQNKDNEENNRYRSHSMTDLHSVTNFESRRSRTETADNHFYSGLPDTRFYNGREHRVVKENGFGSEFFIYSPSTFHGDSDKYSAGENRSSRPGSVYEFIDTDTKFEIKRPTIIEQSHHF